MHKQLLASAPASGQNAAIQPCGITCRFLEALVGTGMQGLPPHAACLFHCRSTYPVHALKVPHLVP
jgi:hypothetical protein